MWPSRLVLQKNAFGYAFHRPQRGTWGYRPDFFLKSLFGKHPIVHKRYAIEIMKCYWFRSVRIAFWQKEEFLVLQAAHKEKQADYLKKYFLSKECFWKLSSFSTYASYNLAHNWRQDFLREDMVFKADKSGLPSGECWQQIFLLSADASHKQSAYSPSKKFIKRRCNSWNFSWTMCGVAENFNFLVSFQRMLLQIISFERTLLIIGQTIKKGKY